ncbi:MAG: hypothetical protein KOO60_03610 [Gemmatimonadales bacterium]|nr:hypothetical protein [Gemmatimonadales bacterium]
MKRQSNNHLSGRRLILPALAVLTLSFLAIPSSSQAGIRFGVKVKTPTISAVFHSDGPGPGLHVKVHPRYRDYQITKVDRKIAMKLAKRTPYSRHELLQLRRVGYSWNEIGRLLRLSPKMMRKALRPYQSHIGDLSRHTPDRCDDDRRGRKPVRKVFKSRIIR